MTQKGWKNAQERTNLAQIAERLQKTLGTRRTHELQNLYTCRKKCFFFLEDFFLASEGTGPLQSEYPPVTGCHGDHLVSFGGFWLLMMCNPLCCRIKAGIIRCDCHCFLLCFILGVCERLPRDLVFYIKHIWASLPRGGLTHAGADPVWLPLSCQLLGETDVLLVSSKSSELRKTRKGQVWKEEEAKSKQGRKGEN